MYASVLSGAITDNKVEPLLIMLILNQFIVFNLYYKLIITIGGSKIF